VHPRRRALPRGEIGGHDCRVCVSESALFAPRLPLLVPLLEETPARLVDHAGSGERGLAPSRVLAANANAVRRASCYTAVRAAEDR
jgi:hypothetical protein